MKRRHFAALAALAVALAGLRLAWWQFDRAEQKRAQEAAAAKAANAPAVVVGHWQAAAIAPFARADVVGRYLPQEEILLENRARAGALGYHIATPFALVDGGAVVIKRGWLAATAAAREAPPAPPPPAGLVTVRGVFYYDDTGAFSLADDLPEAKTRQWLRLQKVSLSAAAPLATLLLIKEGGAEAALPPVALPTNFKSARSLVYAWQWLGLAAVAAVAAVYGALAARRKK